MVFFSSFVRGIETAFTSETDGNVELRSDRPFSHCKRIPTPIYGRVKDEFDKLVAGDAEQVHAED